MSLDELDEALTQYLQALTVFNERMASGWEDLQRAWQECDSLWSDDSMRRRFDDDWGTMAEALEHYHTTQAALYVEFLLRRKQALDEYFGRSLSAASVHVAGAISVVGVAVERELSTETTMTQLTFHKDGKPLRAGLECSIHWEGYSTWLGRGHTILRTNDQGSVVVDNDLIRPEGSTPEKIFIDNPDGGYSLYYEGITLRRGGVYVFDLQSAKKQ